ncbi:MAG: iron dependent repressor, metal binding and dimerization domain protein, partial [Acidobacteriota bacterium]
GAVGALMSASIDRLPTGPVIVLVSSTVLILSLLLAPGRGLIWSWLDDRRLVRRIVGENILRDLYVWGERAENFHCVVSWPDLQGLRGYGPRQLRATTRRLARHGHLDLRTDGIRLTESGLERAAGFIRKHRLWELYLTHRLDLAADHVHRDADAMEHTLSDAAVAVLDEKLGFPSTDPHGRPIPRPGHHLAEPA